MSIVKRLRFLLLFWPFRWALFLGAMLVLWVVGTDNAFKGEAFIPVELHLIIWMILASSFIIVFIALFFLCLYWCLLFFQRKKIHLHYDGEYFIVEPVFQPFLGALQLRLKRNQQWDEEVIIMSPTPSYRFHLGHIAMQGQLKHSIPAIRVEQVDGIMIHLVDTFHFFSFSLYLPIQLQYEQKPIEGEEKPQLLLRGNSDIDEVKTMLSQKKRADDLFQLKSFEPGDDIRRIVWKLFARHRTLMVRKPDMEKEYSKNTKVLVIFDFSPLMNSKGDLLTYLEALYKQKVYNVVCGLLANGRPIDISFNGRDWHTGVTNSQLRTLITNVNYNETIALHELKGDSIPNIVFTSSLSQMQYLDALQSFRMQWVLVDVFHALNAPLDSFWTYQLIIRPNNYRQYRIHRTWLGWQKRKLLLDHWKGMQEKLAHLTYLYVA